MQPASSHPATLGVRREDCVGQGFALTSTPVPSSPKATTVPSAATMRGPRSPARFRRDRQAPSGATRTGSPPARPYDPQGQPPVVGGEPFEALVAPGVDLGGVGRVDRLGSLGAGDADDDQRAKGRATGDERGTSFHRRVVAHLPPGYPGLDAGCRMQDAGCRGQDAGPQDFRIGLLVGYASRVPSRGEPWEYLKGVGRSFRACHHQRRFSFSRRAVNDPPTTFIVILDPASVVRDRLVELFSNSSPSSVNDPRSVGSSGRRGSPPRGGSRPRDPAARRPPGCRVGRATPAGGGPAGSIAHRRQLGVTR